MGKTFGAYGNKQIVNEILIEVFSGGVVKTPTAGVFFSRLLVVSGGAVITPTAGVL